MMKEDFIKAGYTRFNPSPLDDECITDMFQKSFRDEDGDRLYFITVERWDYTPVARGRDIPIQYNFSTQLETLKDQTLNIDCFDNFDIETAEAFYKDLWDTGWFKPYDKKE